MFGIETTTYKTLGTKYMTLGYGHLLESGVVAINRSLFWPGLFITLHLSQVRPVHENVWGDKELFWIGQSIAGNENYEFNDYWAAAVGQLTPDSQRTAFKSRELCSTHPGHISSDTDELMWVNSGLQTCRQAQTYETDFEVYNATLGFDDKYQLKEYYESTLKIESALIPPDSLYWVDYLDTPREPRQGFIKQYNCAAYWWCAYDTIGGSEFPEHQGKIFNFSVEDIVLFDYVGAVYVGDN
ncbi:unnamed protein product [Ambrosiozyma monospora]|uniref:Unnamed protein product n=1 Tax=Ambrosiozyma monospora TaxID=43982 RepID=A0ACB5UB86_AMBMO|nr:unnamed protein product [Ambrosiozyma monospora]